MNDSMKIKFLTVTFIALSLGACESTKEQIGLNKQVPDEFQVVKRAPLSLPPDFVLRPPRPGAPRPQEQTTSDNAAAAVFGAENVPAARSDISSGEAALLSQAGSDAADPGIRARVDDETAQLFDRNKPVAEKLFGLGGGRDIPSASVVDAEAEKIRILENQEAGKPITGGETPSIEE